MGPASSMLKMAEHVVLNFGMGPLMVAAKTKLKGAIVVLLEVGVGLGDMGVVQGFGWVVVFS
jgi:hypothetical protein